MNTTEPKNLMQALINQYQEKHNRLPAEILVHPAAAIVLAYRRCLAPMYAGIPVRLTEIASSDVGTGNSTRLGITVLDAQIVSFDV